MTENLSNAAITTLFETVFLPMVEERCAKVDAQIMQLRHDLLGSPREIAKAHYEIAGREVAPGETVHGFMVHGHPVHPDVFRLVQSLSRQAMRLHAISQELDKLEQAVRGDNNARSFGVLDAVAAIRHVLQCEDWRPGQVVRADADELRRDSTEAIALRRRAEIVEKLGTQHFANEHCDAVHRGFEHAAAWVLRGEDKLGWFTVEERRQREARG